MDDPKVSIIILNWNKPDDTIECLESVYKIDYPNKDILLVDNHSTDDSVVRIQSRFSELKILVNGENLGYAAGNNAGIRRALTDGADYFLILNNDTTVDNNLLRVLIDAALKNPRAGLLAPKVLLADDPTMINSLGTRIDWFKLRPHVGRYRQFDDGLSAMFIKQDILMGCALLFSRQTVLRIGLFDEAFFLIHEDADFCLRNLESGFENLVVTRTAVYHKCSNTLKALTGWGLYYSVRNFLRLSRLHASVFERAATTVGLFLFLLQNLYKRLSGNPRLKNEGRLFCWAVADYWRARMGKSWRPL